MGSAQEGGRVVGGIKGVGGAETKVTGNFTSDATYSFRNETWLGAREVPQKCEKLKLTYFN